MRHFFYLLFFPSLLFAQEPNLSRSLRKAALEDYKEAPIPYSVRTQQRLEEYVEKIVHSTGVINDSNQESEEELKAFFTCLRSTPMNVNLYELCRNEWEELSAQRRGFFQSREILSPGAYLKNLDEQETRKNEQIEVHEKPDELIVIEDFFVLEETTPEQMLNLAAIDPEIKSLSRDVQEILVKIYSSEPEEDAARSMEASTLEASEAKSELIELTQILSVIDEKRNPCWADGNLQRISGSELLKLSGADRLVLGVSREKNLDKVEAFKFSDNGHSFYLYRLRDHNLNEDSWVLAKVDGQGNMNFRYFKIKREQQERISITDHDDLKIIKGPVQKTTLDVSGNDLYLQMQAGLGVKGRKQNLFGGTFIPKNDIVIGHFSADYFSQKVLLRNNFALNFDEMNLTTETSSLSNHNWSLRSSVKFKQLSGETEVSGDVRVYNFLLGYTDNLRGGQGAQVSYVFDTNVLKLKVSDHNTIASFGRRLGKNRGLVSLESDFKKNHEVKIFYFLD